MQDTMTRQEELQSIYWDMYKDAMGVRPRGIDTSSWTELAFENEFNFLAGIIKSENEERMLREDKASIDFEYRMQSLLMSGAKDREMALRWIHEAEGTHGDDEYLCFTLGLPYRYFDRT